MSFFNRFGKNRSNSTAAQASSNSSSTTSSPQQQQQQQQSCGSTSSPHQHKDPASPASPPFENCSAMAAGCASCPSLEATVRRLEDELRAARDSLSAAAAASTAPMSADLPQPRDEKRVLELEREQTELRETVSQLMEEIAARDRALKRNESMAKDTLRAKERQIVQQSNQIADAQSKLSTMEAAVQERDAQLLRARQRLVAFEGRALDGQEERTSLQQHTEEMLQQRDASIRELQSAVAQSNANVQDVRRLLAACEEKCIRLGYDVQTRDGTIVSLKEALEGERRMALLRGATSSAASSPTERGGVDGLSSPAASGPASGNAIMNRGTRGGAGTSSFEHVSTTGTANTIGENEASAAGSSGAGDAGNVGTATISGSQDSRIREALSMEAILRAKDKHVIRLSNEVVSLRADIGSLQLTVTQLREEKGLLEATAASATSALDEARQRLELVSNELRKRTQQIAELRAAKGNVEEAIESLKDQYASLLREADELRAQSDAYRSFRVQHVDCQARIVDKDLALFQSSTALSECRGLLEKAHAEIEVLTQQVARLNAQCHSARDDSSVQVSRHTAHIVNLELQLAERKRCIHELEDAMSARNESLEEATNELTSLRALREDERETWRTKTQQAQDAMQQLQQSMCRQNDHHQLREKQLLDQIEKLQMENNQVLQARREQEAHVLHLSEMLRREQQDKMNNTAATTNTTRVSSSTSPNESSLPNNAVMFKSPSAADVVSNDSRGGGGEGILRGRNESVGADAPPALRLNSTRSSVAAPPGSTAAATATTSLQRVSLELEEMRQKYNRVQRDVAAKDQTIENLLRRLHDAEGAGGGDGATSSASERRRLTGIFESLSVELCHQLASHLRVDYLRNGASLTLPAVMASFHLGKDEASEMMDALSRTMLMVRLHIPIPRICTRLGVKESSVKRIIGAFARCGVQASEDDNSRRLKLLSDSPPAALFTYSGHERLALLMATRRGRRSDGEPDDASDEEDDASPSATIRTPIQRLGRDPYVTALICSYLPVVLRGNTAFAAHAMHRVGTSAANGQTLLISLDPHDNTFSLMECEVTPTRTIVVLLSGSYRSGFSWQSCSHVKVSLSCRTKQDGQWHAAAAPAVASASSSASPPTAASAAAGKWKWSAAEKLPRDEATPIAYNIKRETMTDGLVAETKGVRLRELSVQEVVMIQELYSGDLSGDEMMHHRSWEMIPSPTPVRRSR